MKKSMASIALAALLPAAAFAADADKAGASHCLAPIVVTPARYESSVHDTDTSVSVVTADQISTYVPKTVPEVLKDEAGVYVRDYTGNGKTVNVDIRGFGESAPSNILVLIDGRRSNQVDLSGVDWSQINVDSIERIEVVRGPQSVLYGDNAVGGVVNIITKNGAGKEPQVQLGYKVGTYDYAAYSAQISGGSPFLDYFADLTQSSTDGHRTNADLQLIDFAGSLTVKPSSELRLDIKGGYHKDWYGQPGGVTPAVASTAGRGGTATPNDRAKTLDQYIMVTPRYDYTAKDGEVTLSGDVIVRGRRTASSNYWPGAALEFDNHIKTFGLTPKIAISGDAGAYPNTILVGMDYYSYKDEILNGFTLPKDMIVIEEQTFGLYVTDTLELTPRFSLTGGGRLERACFRFDQQAVIPIVVTRRLDEYALDAGATYEYRDNGSLYARYARSFRFPAVDEWFQAQYFSWFTGLVAGGLNADLVPQTGNHYEIGVREDSLKYLTINADVFVSDMRHELYYSPITFMNAVYDRTMRQGFECESHIKPTEELDIVSRYTYLKAFFVGSHYAGNEIPMVPRDKLSAGVTYTLQDSFSIGYLANFTGKRYYISDQLNIAPLMKSHVTHDLKLSYKKYGLSLFMAVYNILDEQYAEYGITNATGTNFSDYTSPGRNVAMGVNYSF